MEKEPQIEFLPIETSDIPEIAYVNLLAETGEVDPEQHIIFTNTFSAYFNEIANQPNHYCQGVKAVFNGDIVGFVFAVSYAPCIGETPKSVEEPNPTIEALMVHRDFRRQGIGEGLLKTALQVFRDKGERTIRLYANSLDYPLLQFYQAVGWARDNSRTHAANDGSRQYVEYRRDLV